MHRTLTSAAGATKPMEPRSCRDAVERKLSLWIRIGFPAWILVCLMSTTAFGQGPPTAAPGAGGAAQGGITAGAAAPSASPQVLHSPLPAPSVEGSTEKTLLVTASPFNAKCDGAHDDQAAIQAAFNEALTHGERVEFPARTCLTSTIVWKGQAFYGAGQSVTIIRGMPGQDVFQTPDGRTWTTPTYGTLVNDIQIQVDNTVDASRAPQGNGTFPNRIAGDLGGSLGGTHSTVSPPITPGPEAFGTVNGYFTHCTATINAGTLNTLIFTGSFCAGGLTVIDRWRVIGAPITIHGVGPGGGDLVTTVASVISDTLPIGPATITLTSPATRSGTNLSGTWLNPLTPPWYIGNCGFAFPDSDGAHPSPNIGHFGFRNVMIIKHGGPQSGNHSCGIFMQSAPYASYFDKVQIQGLYGGYVEALPAYNPGGATWTGDTSSFKDMDLQFDLIPFVIQGGNHRTFNGINIYGGVQHQNLGAMWIHPGSSATISRFYFECQTTNTGEIERFSGLYGINIQGGSLDQCGPAHYVLWNASRSSVDAIIGSLQIASGANQNVFAHAAVGASFVKDNGLGNSVETNGSVNSVSNPRAYFANRPQSPLGKLDGGWLLSGNSATPFTSADDLLLTCSDFNFSTSYNSSAKQYDVYCVPDPNGTEITESYFHATSAAFSRGWNLGPGAQGTGPNGKLLTVGDRLPQAPMTFVVLGRCNKPCTQHYTVSDREHPREIAGANLNFDSNWTIRSFPMDLSSVPEGDQITVEAGSPWAGGTNTMDTAFWAFEPINVDTIKAAVAATLAALSQRGATSDREVAASAHAQPSNSTAAGTAPGAKHEFSGTTNPIGGTALRTGQCVSGAAPMPEAAIGMAVVATPSTYPGDGIAWRAYVSGQGSVTVKVCAEIGGIPKATTYNVRAIP